MTNKVVWDSDCMSSFLSVESMGIPLVLIGNKMIIPEIETIWKSMVDVGCKIGSKTFSEYLAEEKWRFDNKYSFAWKE